MTTIGRMVPGTDNSVSIVILRPLRTPPPTVFNPSSSLRKHYILKFSNGRLCRVRSHCDGFDQ